MAMVSTVIILPYEVWIVKAVGWEKRVMSNPAVSCRGQDNIVWNGIKVFVSHFCGLPPWGLSRGFELLGAGGGKSLLSLAYLTTAYVALISSCFLGVMLPFLIKGMTALLRIRADVRIEMACAVCATLMVQSPLSPYSTEFGNMGSAALPFAMFLFAYLLRSSFESKHDTTMAFFLLWWLPVVLSLSGFAVLRINLFHVQNFFENLMKFHTEIAQYTRDGIHSLFDRGISVVSIIVLAAVFRKTGILHGIETPPVFVLASKSSTPTESEARERDE